MKLLRCIALFDLKNIVLIFCLAENNAGKNTIKEQAFSFHELF